MSCDIGPMTCKNTKLINIQYSLSSILSGRGQKAKDIIGYKLWYIGEGNKRNGVGIIAIEDLQDEIVDVERIGDRIISIKHVIEIISIISPYAPQVRFDNGIKKYFWENVDLLIQEIREGERIFIGWDLNGGTNLL